FHPPTPLIGNGPPLRQGQGGGATSEALLPSQAARPTVAEQDQTTNGPSPVGTGEGWVRAPLRPKPLAGEAGAFGEHAELLPHDRGVAALGEGALGEAAVGAGDHVLAADQPGIVNDPLGYELGVLDAVRRVG